MDDQCPKRKPGDNSSHHWIPKRVSSYRGEPQFEMRCTYCHITQAEWRKEQRYAGLDAIRELGDDSGPMPNPRHR